jgi:hypothetical protein
MSLFSFPGDDEHGAYCKANTTLMACPHSIIELHCNPKPEGRETGSGGQRLYLFSGTGV